MGKKTKTGKGRLDKYYHLARDHGYRARSAFKLIQLAKKKDFLSDARVCIDLCAAPGGWAQVAQRNMPAGALIIAIDLVAIKPIHGVTCIQSDITTEKCRNLIKKATGGAQADVVLHDGAPNVGTSWAQDAYSQAELTLQATKLACESLRPGGTFVTKVFRSADYNSLLWVFNQLFSKVDATKPTASRNVSAEIFVMCLGFKGGMIDPKFFNPKWVFMEIVEAKTEAGVAEKKPSSALNEYVKHMGKKHRGGYEPGDDFRVTTAGKFIEATNPAEMLVTHHKILLDNPEDEVLAKHPLTTSEVRELCDDLKVLSKKDLSGLLKWRMKILREREREQRKAAREAKLKAEADAKETKSAEAADALNQDVDDAIAAFLDDDTKPKKEDADDDKDDEEAAEELEKELAEQVESRRREERRLAKSTMRRQRKQEMRRKMSLNSKSQIQDQPELFRATKKSMKALEDQDKYVDARKFDSDHESSEGSEQESESSDGSLDAFTKMEVDVAVFNQLQQEGWEDKFRSKMKRKRRNEKETRRKRVMQAWSSEFAAFGESLEDQNAKRLSLEDGEDDDDDDDDDDEEDLKALRDLQEKQRKALEDGDEGAAGLDGVALEALADGPPPDVASEAEEAAKTVPARVTSTDIVPVKEDDEEAEEALRAVHRADRWFSQDIFRTAGSGDDDSDAGSGGEVREIDESLLPKMPLTDKEKRKLKRKQQRERNDRRNTIKVDDAEKLPMEVAPLEPPKPLVPMASDSGKFKKPTDPRELAETLALGSLLIESKKSRMELIDAGYNRYTFDQQLDLPDWFVENENKHNKPELPISKELMDQFRAKMREINARPIRKVAQAKARKKRRLQKRLEKLRGTALSLMDTPDMSEAAKARQMRKAVNQAAKQERRKVTVVAIKKGGGGNRGNKEKGKVPKGAKTKVVDRRMKSDKRGEKKANKRDPKREKRMVRKQFLKQQKQKLNRGGIKKGNKRRRDKGGDKAAK